MHGRLVPLVSTKRWGLFKCVAACTSVKTVGLNRCQLPLLQHQTSVEEHSTFVWCLHSHCAALYFFEQPSEQKHALYSDVIKHWHTVTDMHNTGSNGLSTLWGRKAHYTQCNWCVQTDSTYFRTCYTLFKTIRHKAIQYLPITSGYIVLFCLAALINKVTLYSASHY